MPETQTPTTASWGVSSTVSGDGSVTGIVTSIETGAEAVVAPEYDEKGRVIKQTHYDTKFTASCTVEVGSSEELPEPGDPITIGDFSGYVLSAKLTEENQSYRKIAITAECYANCTAVTDETSST